MADRIPIAAAEQLGKRHEYDQVIILARRVGEPGLEWVTTWGKNPAHCAAAAQIGAALRDSVAPTIERLTTALASALPVLKEDRQVLINSYAEGCSNLREDVRDEHALSMLARYDAAIELCEASLQKHPGEWLRPREVRAVRRLIERHRHDDPHDQMTLSALLLRLMHSPMDGAATPPNPEDAA